MYVSIVDPVPWTVYPTYSDRSPRNGPIPARRGALSFRGFPGSPRRYTYMAYSRFNCAGCGKMKEVCGSKVVMTPMGKTRICEPCKLLRERQQKREAENGTNG